MDRLRQIELTVRVAETGSFAKAAATLGITPSAISHAVAELEKQLHCTLFYRTTRQVKLTEDGEAFCRRGREVLEKLAEMDAPASRGATRLEGKLRIGVGTVIAQHLVMPRLAEFLKLHPGLSVECRQRWHVKDMHAEGMDLLLWVGEAPDPGVIAHQLCEIRLGVYAAPSYLKTYGVPKHPRDLAHHRCAVFYPVSWATKPLDTWEFNRGDAREVIKLNAIVLCDERENLISAAVNGVGIIRTGLFDPALIASGRLRRILEDWHCPGGPSLYVMYRKAQRQSPKVKAFVEFVRELVAAFDPEGLTVNHPKPSRSAQRWR